MAYIIFSPSGPPTNVTLPAYRFLTASGTPPSGNLINPPTIDKAISPPPSANEALAIKRAEWWIINEGPEAADNDRLLRAVEVAAKVREFGVPEAAAPDCCQAWTDFWCDPPLEPHQINEAVHIAYSLPPAVPVELADTVEEPPPGVIQPGAQPAPAPLQGGPQAAVARPQPDAQAAPAPSPTASEPAPQPQPVDTVDVETAEHPEFFADSAVAEPETSPGALADADQRPDKPAAHEVLLIKYDQGHGGRETLLKLQAAGEECPLPKTTVTRGPDRVLRFVYSLLPDTHVRNGTLGPGISVMGCSESAALEGYEVIKDLPRALPAKIVLARFTVRVPSPADENASVSTKNTRMEKKRVGRPPGRTKARPFQMRVDDAFITKIDDWRREQPDFPNRTESVRRLVDQALNGKRG
jgi:hypothetical protein